MHSSARFLFVRHQRPQLGPVAMGAGLVLLGIATWWPAVPVVTAMACVALGATDVTLTRFRRTAAIVPIVLLHALTYTGLYALFVGAVCHAATTGPRDGLSFLQTLDLGASAGVMMRVLWLSMAPIAGGGDAPAR